MANIIINTDKAIANIDKLVAKLDGLNQKLTETQNVSSAGFGQLNTAISNLASTVNQLTSALSQSNKQLTTSATKTRQQAGATRQATRAVNQNTTAVNRNTSAQRRGSIIMGKFTRGVWGLVAAFGYGGGLAYILGKVLLGIWNNMRAFESFQYTLQQITKTTKDYQDALGFTYQISQRYGVGLSDLTDRYIKFQTASRLAGLTLRDTQKIFESMTKAGAILGLKTDELRGIYLALEQMLSKGKVTTEELRRQLGERLPGAMAIMARAVGVTLPELDKMMKKGEVLSAEVLPAFAEEVERSFGIENVERVETLNASIGRLQSSWEKFLQIVADSDSILGRTIKAVLDSMSSVLDRLGVEFSDFMDLQERAVQDLGSEYEKFMKRTAQSQVVALYGYEDYQAFLKDKAKALEASLKLSKDASDEEKKIAKDKMTQISQIEDQIFEKMRLEAKNNLSEVRQIITNNLKTLGLFSTEDWEFDLIDTDRWDDRMDQIMEGIDDPASLISRWNLELKDTSKNLMDVEESVSNLFQAMARYKTYKNIMEEGSVDVLPGGDTDTTKRAPSIKYAKQYTPDYDAQIAELQRLIDHHKHLYNIQDQSIGQMIESQKAIDDYTEQINILNEANELIKVDDWYSNKIAEWDKALSRHVDENGKRLSTYAEQEAQYNEQLESLNEERLDKIDQISEKFKTAERQRLEDMYNMRLDFINKVADINERIAKVDETEQTRLAELAVYNTATGTTAQAKALLELERLKIKLFNAEKDREAQRLQDILTSGALTTEQEDAMMERIASVLNEKREMPKSDLEALYTGDGSWESWTNLAMDSLNEVGALVDSLFERRIAQIQEEIDKTTDLYDTKIRLARDDKKQIEALEYQKRLTLEKLEKKKRKEQIKQARFDKALNITNALQNTALGITRALGEDFPLSLILGAIYAAIGAAQIASIASTPIPAYAKGGDIKSDHLGLINDGGRKEYIERDGKIYTTDQVNAVVPLKRNDIIYPNFEEMQRKSMLMNAMYQGADIEGNDFDAYFNGMEMAIAKGWRKANINTNVSVNNNGWYAQKHSRWN